MLHAPTISAALATAAKRDSHRGFTFQDGDGRETEASFAALLPLVHARAAALQAAGVRPGDRVALVENDVRTFVETFLALVECGAVAVPMAPPAYVAAREHYVAHVRTILAAARARLVLVGPSSSAFFVPEELPEGVRVVATTSLAAPAGAFDPVRIGADDLAFLQFTSGSTGVPKGVRVTHGALVANIRAFMRRLEADPERDRGVSWLPLYHDMGLIGFVLAPLYCGVPCVLLPTVRFVRKPTVWLEAIQRHTGTITFAPSFALSLLMRRVRPGDVARWDLSSIKAFGCGAEPIHAETLAAFVEHFAPAGLRSSMLVPAYGLAESCLAVTMKRIGAPLVTRARVDARGRGHVDVGCGEPLEGHHVEIRGPAGEVLPEGREGEVWTSGPSLADGYDGHPQATAKTFAEGKLRTGDLGYVRDGQLFVTGRIKDLVIVHGRNYHPHAFEWATAEVDGVRAGSVVAFSRPGSETEELVILAETTRPSPELKRAIAVHVQQHCEVTPTVIELLPPGTLPKTSSGKLRRGEARRAYLDGAIP